MYAAPQLVGYPHSYRKLVSSKLTWRTDLVSTSLSSEYSASRSLTWRSVTTLSPRLLRRSGRLPRPPRLTTFCLSAATTSCWRRLRAKSVPSPLSLECRERENSRAWVPFMCCGPALKCTVVNWQFSLGPGLHSPAGYWESVKVLGTTTSTPPTASTDVLKASKSSPIQ